MIIASSSSGNGRQWLTAVIEKVHLALEVEDYKLFMIADLAT